MFKRKGLNIIIVVILIIIIMYTFAYREYFEAELESKRTNERIDKLTSEIESIKSDFEKNNEKMKSQGQQAAAMSATLQAIPTGFNPSPLPTI